jgi:hypothetical protein
MDLLTELEVEGLTLAASQLKAHKADLVTMLDGVDVQVVDGGVKLIESADSKVPGIIRGALNSAIEKAEPQIVQTLETFEGDGIDKLVAVLEAAAAHLSGATTTPPPTT